MLSDLKTGGATAGRALVNWWRAVSIEALCCAILWLVGLLLIRVPLAPLWALIAGLMTFIPNFGASGSHPLLLVPLSDALTQYLGFA